MLKNLIPKVGSEKFLPGTVKEVQAILQSRLSFDEAKKTMSHLLQTPFDGKDPYIIRHETADIKLASGKLSNFYCEIKDALAKDKLGKALTAMMLTFFDKNGFGEDVKLLIGSNGVGGAIPTSKVSVSRSNASDLLDRLTVKDYSSQKRFVGRIEEEETIILLDDVLTTGGNMRKTITELREMGKEPAALFVFVNRSDADDQKLITEVDGVPVHQIFTSADFKIK